MDTETRMDLVRSVGEEILTEEELRNLLETKDKIIAYDGFEPSGKIHIAQGVLRALNVNKLAKAGISFKMYAADWHAWANNKLGGDLEKIHTVGDYLVEVWKQTGMDLDNVTFVRASDIVSNDEYWKKVMQIARAATVKRVLRCSQIMGRSENEALQASQILYPCMQAADIFELEADICQLGMDQRKVNVMAREIGPKLGWYKPVVVSHHMLMGLGQPAESDSNAVERAIEMKMSKSKPDSAIFMTDTEEEISRKLKKAWCPEKQAEENPVLEYCRYLIFEKFDELIIRRPEKWGGNLEYHSYDELANGFAKGDIHPMDLKTAVSERINEIIAPVREHFEKNEKARNILSTVQGYEITR